MKFFGMNMKGCIVTDDYTQDEIDKGLHFVNLRKDLRSTPLRYIDVYDENMVFIRRLGK